MWSGFPVGRPNSRLEGLDLTNRAPPTLGRRTAPRSDVGSVDAADLPPVPGEAAVDPETPGPSAWALCQKRYRDNPLTVGGKIPTFDRPHCDYAYSNASRDVVSAARRQHLTRWHDGDGLPGPIRAVTGAFRGLSAAEVRDDAFDWKCPASRFGLDRQPGHWMTQVCLLSLAAEAAAAVLEAGKVALGKGSGSVGKNL